MGRRSRDKLGRERIIERKIRRENRGADSPRERKGVEQFRREPMVS